MVKIRWVLAVISNDWKEAIVTPVIKKGSKDLYENYRPVSCLPAAGKLLESIVCDQVSNFMESQGLIPETQHGFRTKRSTQHGPKYSLIGQIAQTKNW